MASSQYRKRPYSNPDTAGWAPKAIVPELEMVLPGTCFPEKASAYRGLQPLVIGLGQERGL